MHFQNSIPDWPVALAACEPAAGATFLFKAVLNPDLLREAAERWTSLGRDPARLVTDYRHFDLYFPRGDWESLKAQWRSMFFRFVNRTYLEQHAPYVQRVEENNEYFTTEQALTAATFQPYLDSMRAACAVWNGEFRGRTVISPDGGWGAIRPDCRLVLANGFVTHTIPRSVYQLAVAEDAVIGYHAYTRWDSGQRAADDWPNHSGLWARLEAEYGVKPRYAFTECGPYAGTAEGWRHPVVLGAGDLDTLTARLAAAMVAWWTDVAATPAYREGRIDGGAWFTSGSGGSWPWYELETPQLVAIARGLSGVRPPAPVNEEPDMTDEQRAILSLAAESLRQTAESLQQAVAALRHTTESLEGLAAAWWLSWPSGLLEPARRLAVPLTPIQMYRADGTAIVGVLRRNGMDAFERQGNLLRVTSSPISGAYWWVRGQDTQPA